LAIGVCSLVLLIIVERRVESPMLPLALFRSRPFALANLLTLLLYAALSVVDPRHAGAASGVNNAVARVAGLLAIAVFGVVLARTFDARVRTRLDQLALPSPARAAIDRELPKM